MPAYEPIMDTSRPWTRARVSRVIAIVYLTALVGFVVVTLARGLWLDANATSVQATVVHVQTGREGLFFTVELPDAEHHHTKLWTSRRELRPVGATMLVEYVPTHPGLVREAGTFAPMGVFQFAACSLPVCLAALFLIQRHIRRWE